jgi:hypothetical protein
LTNFLLAFEKLLALQKQAAMPAAIISKNTAVP